MGVFVSMGYRLHLNFTTIGGATAWPETATRQTHLQEAFIFSRASRTHTLVWTHTHA